MMNRAWMLGMAASIAVTACGDDGGSTGGEGGSTSATTSGSGGSGDGGGTTGNGGNGDGGDPAGTGGGGGAGVSASATITGDGIDGTATFTMVGDQVTFVVNITGVSPDGNHAIHIHENPDCSGDLSAAGGHWNPTGAVEHGVFDQGGHLGDIGDIPVAGDTGTLTVNTNLWSVAPAGTDVMKNVVGHSLIVHAMDNADPGPRLACGIVTLD